MDKQNNETKHLGKISLLKKQLIESNKEVERLDEENLSLVTELTSLKNNFGRQILDMKSQLEEKSRRRENELLKERGEKSSKEEWEKIIDEMAHSINSDVYVAVSYLSQISSNPIANIALSHTKQIRDLINLIMLYLKRKDIEFTGDIVEVSVKEYVEDQINTIKNSLSTLRLSTDEHEEALSEVEVPIEITGDINFKTPIEFKDAISLIVKDLMRNAFKNTPEENPHISVKIAGGEKHIKLIIKNNKAISDDFSNWFNGNTDVEPKISKSSKVGLSVILKWTKYLGINAILVADKLNNTTIAELTFPKEIKHEE